MTETHTNSDEPYAGPDDATIAVGKGKLYSWAGRASGFVIGSVVAYIGIKGENAASRSAQKWFEKFGLDVSPRTTIVAGGGFLGSVVGHYTGWALGIKQGMKEAGHGREQFERVKAERDTARTRVAELEAERAANTGVERV